MQSTSDEYKAGQKRQLREQSYVWVYLGIINKQAQASANIEHPDLLPVSNESGIYSSNSFEALYGMAEEGLCKVDGTTFFPPRDPDMYALYQGVVTSGVVGDDSYGSGSTAIKFVFTGRNGSGAYRDLPIKGLTIDFGDAYPTEFIVTNGNNTYTYTNNAPGIWSCEDVFDDTSYIMITPVKMVGGHQRMRILSISFGKGLTFDNSTLLSTSRKNKVAHISDTLPSKSFTFVVSNINKQFSKDDPKSFINYLQEMQEVDFEYGRDICTYDEYGNVLTKSVYHIPGGVTALKTWSSNDTKATFNSVGFLDYNKDKYYKGQYYPDGISLYQLAENVLSDGGFKKYHIDSYLKGIHTHNPLPIDTHKALLQLIANASRSILWEGRDGTVNVSSSFTPKIKSVTMQNATDWSDADSLVSVEAVSNYGSLDAKHTRADSGHLFLPGDTTALKSTGYVSNVTANADGYFQGEYQLIAEDGSPITAENGSVIIAEIGSSAVFPGIDIKFEAQWTFYNLKLEFDTCAPTSVEIYGIADGVVVSDKIHKNLDVSAVLVQEFDEVDEVLIEFHRAEPFQRVHLNHIEIGRETDLTITSRDLAESPSALSTDNIKNINVHWYQYTPGRASSSISTTTASAGTNLMTFSAAYSGYSVKYAYTDEPDTSKVSKNYAAGEYFVNNGKLCKATASATSGGAISYEVVTSDLPAVTESGAYYCKFNSPVSVKVQISGYKFDISDNTYTYQLNETGTDKTVKNEIVDSSDLADTQARWLGDYYNYDTEYSITYRGEPAIDCDDLVYLESRYVDDDLIRIESEQLDTSNGMSHTCKLTAKRVSYTPKG